MDSDHFVVGQAKTTSGLNSTDGSDANLTFNKLFHKTNYALAALAPVAFIVPADYSLPFDLVLGIIIPFHSHVALNYVVTDYVPKKFRSVSRMAVLMATLLAAGGILKLNAEGPGLTETIKSLWKTPEEVKGNNHH